MIDAPAVYGPRETLHNRFVRGLQKAKRRVGAMFHAFANRPPAEVLIDIPSAKAHFGRHREHHLGDLVTRLNWRAMSSRRDSLVRNVKAVSLGRSSFQ